MNMPFHLLTFSTCVAGIRDVQFGIEVLFIYFRH